MKDFLAKYLFPIVTASIAVFAPIKEIFIVTTILIFADLVTGVLSAAKQKGWESVKSSGVRRTVSKLLIYYSAIAIGFLIETYMLDSFLPISKVVASTIGGVEGFSIFENLNVLNGKNIFKTAIGLLGSKNDVEEEKEEPKAPQD